MHCDDLKENLQNLEKEEVLSLHLFITVVEECIITPISFLPIIKFFFE